MTTDGTRPNFFIILELSPEAPWDEASYAGMLSEKRNVWALQMQGEKAQRTTIEAQRNLELLREIERVMHSPQARAEERQAAIAEWRSEQYQRRRVITARMEDMLEKGYLLDDEYKRLRGEEAVYADDTLRQRLENAERRSRSRIDADERLDQATEQSLRCHLDVIGQPDLYSALRMADPEIGAATAPDRLLAAADALAQRARNMAGKSHAEVEAQRNLSEVGKQLLGSPELKRLHDATVRFWSLGALVDRYESSMETAREISSRQFEKFLREAAAQEIDLGIARNELIARFHARGWLVEVPSTAFETALRAEVRCPRCSRLNDPKPDHCAHCGRALRGPCPRCGADVAGTARACSACGFPMGEYDYVEHLVGQAESCLARNDVRGADEHAAEAGRMWPVPPDRTDELSDRLRAASARIRDLRVSLRELVGQVDPLMDARNYQTAAQLLRRAVVTHPGLGGHLEECEDAIRVSDQHLRDARAPCLPDQRRIELYTEALQACADNDEAQRELSLISLSPTIPAPVSARACPPRVSLHEVQLDSPPAEQGVVRIICAVLHVRSPQAGIEFPETDLKGYRTIARGDRDIWVSRKEWLRRYTLVLVLHGRCYVGATRWYARGPEVTGLRTDHAGTSVLVTWTWPADVPNGTEVSEALVCWHGDTEIDDPVNVPEHQYVAREQGVPTGRCEIPGRGRLFIKVAAVIRHEGTAYVTSGVRADVRQRLIILRYEVKPGLGRRGKLMISVDGDRLGQLPVLSLRGRLDNKPASQNGDEEVVRIPAGLAEHEVPIKLENMNRHRIEPRSCRLFAANSLDGTTVRIIDPA